MQRTMHLLGVCVLAATALPALHAQQPAHLSCSNSISTGYQSDWGDCTIRTHTANLGTTVPVGKVLVVEDISASCFKFNSDAWSAFHLTTPEISKNMPLQLFGTNSAGGQNWISSLPARLYVKAGDVLKSYLRLQDHAKNSTQCTVRLQGQLVNAQ